MRKNRIFFAMLMLVILIIFPACMNQSEELSLSESDLKSENTKTANKQTFSLRISQNYGETVLAVEEVPYQPNITIMDALYSVYPDEVETAYGGSYVIGIGSLRAQEGGPGKPHQNWVFYVNGIFADVGALDYLPQTGESIWWDYHPWQMLQAVNAVIGCYPEPFVHGYKGKTKTTTILYSSEEKELAGRLEKSLKNAGTPEIVLKEISEEFLHTRSGPTIVIGVWQDLKKYTYLRELNQASSKNGTYVHFTDSSIELLDYNGEKGDELSSGVGVIAASGETAGDDSPLWLVSGTDKEGLRKAVTLLVEKPDKVLGCFSAVVGAKDEVIRLPLLQK